LHNSFRAIKEYSKSTADPIKLHAGDIVHCLEESDSMGDWPNWVLCKSNEAEGWVPAQILGREGDAASILEDYNAVEFDLSPGDVIIMEKELNGWIWGYKEGKPGIKAWAPLNCLEKSVNVEYRDMKPEEAEETMKLARGAFPFWYRLFIWSFKKAIVSVEDGEITGGAARHEIKTKKGNFGYLDFGFTAKESRGKGIGRETYTRSLERLGKDGCRTSGAIVLCDNTASWGLLADNGCTRASAGRLAREFGLLGALKIWFETAFLFVPGAELWMTGEDRKRSQTQAAEMSAFLFLNPLLALLQGLFWNGTPDFNTAGFVFCLMLLTLLFSWVPFRSSGLSVKFRFWRSGLLIPVFVFLSGGVYPLGGGFSPADEKWNYSRVRKPLGHSGFGAWLAAITAGCFLLYIKYFAPQQLPNFQGSFRWVYMLLIFNCFPILLESWPGSRLLKWNKAVFILLAGISVVLLVLIFLN